MKRPFLPMVIVLLSIFAALYSVRTTSIAVMERANKERGRITEVISGRFQRRFEDALENMAKISEDSGKTNLFIGTSLWHFFMDPAGFDRAIGQPSSSYNLSNAGMMGTALYIFMLRLKSEFDLKQMRVKAIFFEFNPMSYSYRFSEHRGFDLDYVLASGLYNNHLWYTLASKHPLKAVDLLFNNSVRPFNRWRFPPIRFLVAKDGNETQALDSGTVPNSWMRPPFVESAAWLLEQRGLYNWNRPAAEEAFQEMRAKIHEDWDHQLYTYAKRHGVDQRFKIFKPAREAFEESVELAKTIADHVYIVVPPYSPSLQAEMEQNFKLDNLYNGLSRSTGVEVIDLSRALTLTNDDFVDPMHASRETVDLYLKALAERIRDKY